MTSYAEMNLQRRKARPVYLELRSLGLQLVAHEDLERPSGYHVEVLGLQSLSPTHADQMRRRVDEHIPGLLRVLWGRWDGDLEAIRREARSK